RAPPGKSTTFPIAMLNGNKRAITLNLKHERGRELLFQMAKKGDVLLENFAPGVMDRLGVGWSVLHAINPRLVYASGTGYGLSGPDREDRKSTRLNSSHVKISYAVFCLKKKNKHVKTILVDQVKTTNLKHRH